MDHAEVETENVQAQPCPHCWQQLVQLARLRGDAQLLAWCAHRCDGVLMSAVVERGVIVGSSFSAPIDRQTAAQALYRHCETIDAVDERQQPGVSLQ